MRSLVGLGTCDAEKARDLGIPSILSDKPAEEAVKARRATAVEASEKEASKFQLGAVLSARIVKRILQGDFVDIAKFSEANLELEMRNAAVTDEALGVNYPQFRAWHRGRRGSASMRVWWSVPTLRKQRTCSPIWP